jgi:hypothetical protein
MSRALHVVLLAAVISWGLAACYSAPRHARTTSRTTLVARVYERCDLNGEHCVRITCDRDADRCWRQSQYASNEYYRHQGRWVCDGDGDRCRYEYRR